MPPRAVPADRRPIRAVAIPRSTPGLAAAAVIAACALLSSCSPSQKPGSPSTIAADTVTLFDHHVHVLSPALIERWKSAGVSFSKPDHAYSDVDSLLALNPADGMFLVSMAYLWTVPGFSGDSAAAAENVRRENDFVCSLARRAPERLFAFCAVDPLRTDAVAELRRCRGERGAYGVKLHLEASGVNLGNPAHLGRVREIFSAASGERMPVLLHMGPARASGDETGGGAPSAGRILLDSLLLPGPPVELFIAHLGSSGGYTYQAREVIQAFAGELDSGSGLRQDRIWFDLSAVALTEGSEEIPALTPTDFTELAADLTALGLRRVVFGTDYPAFNTVAYLEILERELPLSREELMGIAGTALPAGFRKPPRR